MPHLLRDNIHPWLKKHATLLGAYRSAIWLVLTPLIVAGLLLSYLRLADYLTRPAVQLRFSRPNQMVVRVHNPSEKVVRQPKYWMGLFNSEVGSEQRIEALPIPARTGDFIRPGDNWGPNALISLQGVRDKVSHGDRLIGWAYVTCPECLTRGYWVYLQHGVGGWYAEVTQNDPRASLTILRLLKWDTEPAATLLKLIPEDRRVAIK